MNMNEHPSDTFARLVEEELKNAGHPYNGHCAACGAPVVAPKVYCNFKCRARATEKERNKLHIEEKTNDNDDFEI